MGAKINMRWREVTLMVIGVACVAPLLLIVRQSSAAPTRSIAYVAGGVMWVQAGAGQNNTLKTYLADTYNASGQVIGQTFTVYDETHLPVDAGAECRNSVYSGVPQAYSVSCPVASQVVVDAGDGNDYVYVNSNWTQDNGPQAGVNFARTHTIVGGPGNDYIVGGPASDGLIGDYDSDPPGADFIEGGDGNDAIDGGPGNDPYLDGDNGDDGVYGGAGDDSLTGGIGGDLIDGEAGDGDWISYSSRTTPVEVTLSGGRNDGGDADNHLDDVRGIESVVGTRANDELYGTAANETFYGMGGDDFMQGGNGADVLRGGGGEDTISYFDHDTPVYAVLGNKAPNGYRTRSGSGCETPAHCEGDDIRADIENLIGSPKDDQLMGTTKENRIDGGAGDDRIDGSKREDVLIGGPGRDIADYSLSKAAIRVTIGDGPNDGGRAQDHWGDDVTDTIEDVWGGRADDFVQGTPGANELRGGSGDDHLEGRAGNDKLKGDEGNDELFGDADDDEIRGGDGDDEIHGAAGSDTIWGETGADWIFTNDDPASQPATEHDHVNCGAPNPPDTRFDTGDEPKYEDWADIDEFDAPEAIECENIAEPYPDDFPDVTPGANDF